MSKLDKDCIKLAVYWLIAVSFLYGGVLYGN